MDELERSPSVPPTGGAKAFWHQQHQQIVDQPYNHEIERWEFEPGDQVVCELIDPNDGRILTATRHADPKIS
jgi:hypothetical protein